MKIEPKHLAPYFPYGLQFLHQDQVLMLFNLELPHDQNPMWITGWNNVESTEGESSLISVFPDGCEPILRPLSDLTNEIEHNGKKFVPLAEILVAIPSADFRFKIHKKTVIECWCYSDDTNRMKFYLDSIFGLNKYQDVQQLIEWHFDIFGLIEKGLAIDINTLKK